MIEVGRNNIIIRNVDEKSNGFKKITSTFSLYDKVLHKYTASVYTYENGDIFLPSSVSLTLIQGLFPDKETIINYKCPRAKTIDYIMKYQPRDDIQQNALNFLLKMKKDKDNHSRFLSLATGSGKTYVTVNLISQLKKRALIIVDTVDLAQQWKREFLKHTNLLDSEIGIISGQDTVEKEITLSNKKIYIAIHRTLNNIIQEDSNALNRLMTKLGIGIRVFDESHVEFYNICKINSLSNVDYTVFLTATPNRSNFKDDSLYAKVFGKIPYYNGKDIENEKYHTIVLSTFDSAPSFDTKLSIKTKYGFSQARWASHIENDGYEKFLESVVENFEKFKLIERNKKVAIMLPTINLIKKLKDDLEIQYPEISIGTFIGEVSKNKREEELNKKIILTNNKIFGKAIDVKDLEILINYVPIGSIVVTEQILGRLRHNEGMVSILIDITDTGFIECIKQSKIRRRFYKKKQSVKQIIEIKKES